MGEKAGGQYELQQDEAYRTLTAVREQRVFGLLPYNMYTSNYGSTLANSYYLGKLLYPAAFSDIDPQQKAEEIYEFLVGENVFLELNKMFDNLVFATVPVH